MDVNEAFKSALKHLQAGDLRKAELICEDILKVQPENLNAVNFLGVKQSNHSIDFTIE
jgi:hypothetical protein